MAESHVRRVHTQDVLLDIGQDTGALIIYTSADRRGEEIELSLHGQEDRRTHQEVTERRCNGRTVFAAVYPTLAAGPYIIWGRQAMVAGQVEILGGRVVELDWRR